MGSILTANAQSTLTAHDIVDRAARTISPGGKSSLLTFDILGNGSPVRGTMDITRHMYRLDTPAMKIWFDGTTQWALLTDTGELTVTEPTAEETMETNPFAILSQASSAYDMRRGKDTADSHTVILTPRYSSSPLNRAVLEVAKNTYTPRRLTVDFDNGQQMDVKVKTMTHSPGKSAVHYRYDKTRYPAKEIIDLR